MTWPAGFRGLLGELVAQTRPRHFCRRRNGDRMGMRSRCTEVPVRHSRLVILIGLAVSPAALAQTQPAEPACALREPQAPHDRGHGTIVGIEDAARARAGIAQREAQRGGAIDPHYLDDLRVMVRQDNGLMDTFDVPAGTTV